MSKFMTNAKKLSRVNTLIDRIDRMRQPALFDRAYALKLSLERKYLSRHGYHP